MRPHYTWEPAKDEGIFSDIGHQFGNIVCRGQIFCKNRKEEIDTRIKELIHVNYTNLVLSLRLASFGTTIESPFGHELLRLDRPCDGKIPIYSPVVY